VARFGPKADQGCVLDSLHLRRSRPRKTMRYIDLPAVLYTPSVYARLAMPVTVKFNKLFISPGGQVYWTYFEQGKGSVILADDGSLVELKPPHRERFFFPNVQRFPDGRWLIIESRTDTTKPNAFVHHPDGTLINSFYAGDGIQTALLDGRGKIWIGYFDEGITSPPIGDVSYDFGPNGLIRVDDRGRVEFAYNRQHPDKFISDIEAMTIDDESRIWFCPYTEYFLASVLDKQVVYVLSRAPTAGASGICVSTSHFAFFGGFHRSSVVTLVDRATQRLRLVQLHNDDGSALSIICVATRGARAVAFAKEKLYDISLAALIKVLGPWNDDNTSTVASAVQYLDEENSYSDSYLLYPNGPKKIPGKPRPPENKPRSDDAGTP